MIKIVRANEHFHHEEEDWLSTYWHFSFDSYRDPQKMGFGPLRVFNDDVIKPSKGFGFHPHRDMEIVTYVIDGELEHRDDKGNQGVIHAGEIQRMTAGTGITHSEFNHSKEKPLRLLQIWIQANKRGLAPSWEQQKFSPQEHKDKLLPIVVPEKNEKREDGSGKGEENAGNNNNNYSNKDVKDGKAVHIHQDAAIYISTLGAGKQLDHVLGEGRKAYVFMIDGNGTITIDNNGEEESMQKQDVAMLEGEQRVSIRAKDRQADIMLISLPERYDVNK